MRWAGDVLKPQAATVNSLTALTVEHHGELKLLDEILWLVLEAALVAYVELEVVGDLFFLEGREVKCILVNLVRHALLILFELLSLSGQSTKTRNLPSPLAFVHRRY